MLHLFQLIARVDRTTSFRQSIMAAAAKPILTPHEENVKQYLSFLATEMKQIPQDLWLDFKLENMKFVHSYIKKGQATPSATPSATTPQKTGPLV